MANREKFNRDASVLDIADDKYNIQDHRRDHSYSEAKARDIFKELSDPPYIVPGGGVVTTNGTNSLAIDVTSTVAFDSDFREINAPNEIQKPMFDSTSGVVNYLTLQYVLAETGDSRTVFKNTSLSYYPIVTDDYRYQWKLESSINPEILGTETETFDIVKDYNDNMKFATDQASPEYSVTFVPSVASISGDDIGSGSVYIQNGVNDELNFEIDLFTYNLDLTSVSSGEILTLSGVCTRINSLALLANPLLPSNIAFVIDGEQRIRITSPRNLNPTYIPAIASKKVEILAGTAETLLGFTDGTLETELIAKTAQDLADEINLATSPELTAVDIGGKLKIQAQSPIGYVELQSVDHSIYSEVGMSPTIVYGAQQIDFVNDVILAKVTNVGGVATIDTTPRTHTIRLVDAGNGWSEQWDVNTISGDLQVDTTFTISNGNTYVVGTGELEVYVNGMYQHIGEGLVEIGSSGTKSSQFTVNGLVNNSLVDAKVPSASPANIKPLQTKNDGILITNGVTVLDFDNSFNITDETISGTPGISKISLTSTNATSGSVLNHAFLHEFGGAQEIDVTNLSGLLKDAQKTNIYVEGAIQYSRPSINFTGQGITVTDNPLSGFITVDIQNSIFVDDAGDAIVRLGFDGGTNYSSLTIADQNSNPWALTVSNNGELTTTPTIGSTVDLIVESENGYNFRIGVEAILGSGELYTTLISSGVPLVFSLDAPNGKSFGVRVDNSGTLFTLDPDNKFQILDNDGNDIFRIEENGFVYLKKFDSSAISGDINYLPAASNVSGGIALYRDTSGTCTPIFSDGIQFFKFQLEAL